MAHAQHQNASHGLSHVMSKRMLIGVWAALMVGTIVTVAAAQVDLGSSQVNLVVAMVIATIKASLVVMFFMHLLYDKRFNLFIFLASLLFVMIFVSFAMLDSGQYQGDVAQRVQVLEQQR